MTDDDNAEDLAPQHRAPEEKKLSLFSEAWDAAVESKAISGTPRQAVAAGLLGTCIVFVLTMLALPRLDTALHVALVALVLAMPPLAVEVIVASAEFKAGPRGLVMKIFQLVSMFLAEVVGGIGVYVGITAALWHLSGAIGKTFLLATVITLVGAAVATKVIYETHRRTL